MKKSWIIFIIVISIISTLSFYFFQFDKGLSLSNSDWGSFGDYINGVLSPILTIVNIWVFIRLTEVINASDKKQKEAELSHQKKLLLIQLRQNEYDKFSSIINEKLTDVTNENNSEAIYEAHSFLINFCTLKRNLFPIIKTPEFEKAQSDLNKSLIKYRGIYRSAVSIGEEEFKIIGDVYGKILAVNTMLQDFILSEIQ